ncbi:MAG TPA: type II secretion system protein GspN [Desulfosalsimonadaceae bacterium]|nr:type II secretion system protein GspN [Desulfosalsimonadaceae bacterium]
MKKWIGYISYGVIILVAFLYLLFPSREIRDYLVQEAEKRVPGLSLGIGTLAPSLPPGLKFSELDVSLQNQPVFNASQMIVTPRYLSLFSADKSFRLKGDVYQGMLSGDAAVATASKPQYSADIDFEGVQMNAIDPLKELIPHQIFGAAQGDIKYSTQGGPWGEGNGEITVTGCRIEFKPALFGVKELDLGKVNAGIELQNRRASIKKITIKGAQISGNASGSLGLRRPLPQSTIQLEGTLKPHPSLIKELSRTVPSQLLSQRDYVDKGIPFRLSGTLDRPNFSLR